MIYDSMHARPASSVYDSLARQRLLTKRQLELPDDKAKDEVTTAIYNQRKTLWRGQDDTFASVAHLKHILDKAIVHENDLANIVPTMSRVSYSMNAAPPINNLPPGFHVLSHDVGNDPSGK